MVLAVTKENLKLAKTGNLSKFKHIKVLPAAPHSYENSYDKSIRMLELSIDEVIEIDARTFNELVLDDWTWKQTFSTTNSSYKSW